MDRFWRALAHAFPLSLPRARMIERIGAAAVERLATLGVLHTLPLEDGDPYPCRQHAEAGCTMQVVATPGQAGLVAVCGLTPQQCPDEPIAPDDACLLRVSPEALLRLLARAAHLDGTPAPMSWRAPTPLGTRRLGRARVPFAFVPSPARARPWITPDRSVRVLLTPHPDAIPAELHHVPGVEWITLAEALDLHRPTPALDLSDLLERRDFPGLVPGEVLWPPTALVVDEEAGTAHYAGRLLPVQRSPMAVRFLALLAERSGHLVSRRDLVIALWPDDFTTRGRSLVDPIKMDRRIRQLRSKVGTAFLALPAVPGLPQDPVENLRTRSDVEGGYRLTVGATVVER